jgi:hypothetical protein
VIEEVPLVELEKGVQLAGPIRHRHGNVPLGLILRVIEIHRHEAVERLQFLFGEIHVPGHLPGTLFLNCSEIPNSCHFGDFPLGVEVGQMLIDGRNGDLEQRGHQLLGQPDGFLHHTDFDPVLARLPGEDQKLGGAVADLEFVLFLLHGVFLQLSGEGLVQQRLLQRLQRGELPPVEAREALGVGFAHGLVRVLRRSLRTR